MDVDNLNAAFPHRPVTIRDKGWVYGVWYCGAAFVKAELYGQYPMTFLDRVLALFPRIPESEILHCPSGNLTGPGVTMDIMNGDGRCPLVVARCPRGKGDSVQYLPFKNESFSLVISDPPYSTGVNKYQNKKYQLKAKDQWPTNKAVEEFHRVLRPGGYMGILNVRYPQVPKQWFTLDGLISVVCGPNRITRIFAVFRKHGDALPMRKAATMVAVPVPVPVGPASNPLQSLNCAVVPPPAASRLRE
jgi:hypothetical protein